MRNIDKVLETFVNGDYFIVFLVITLVILLVLVLALIKTREDYNELLKKEQNQEQKPIINVTNEENIEKIEEEKDVIDDFSDLMASSEEDKIDADKPLIKQIDVKGIKKYDDIIKDYEIIDEENAVISAEELEKKAKERLDALGTNENQEAIAKYEEEQEKKAIISYEQLLENASNISLSYKEEKTPGKNAPKVNKVELEQKEVTEADMYIKEEEFLKILKEFRISLE